MNPKLIEASLGMLARFIPPEEYAKAVKAINDLVAIGHQLDARLQSIEATCRRMESDHAQRIEMLEMIVRNGVDGANAQFAEQAGWTPERIQLALAPAKEGALNEQH